MYRTIFTRMVSALLLAVIAPMINAAEPHNLRQDGQLLQAARAASGNAADPAFRAALGLSGDEGLDTLRSSADGLGGSVTRYRQTYRGVPVWGEQIVIGRDAAGRVRSLHGRMVRGLAAGLGQLRPALSSEDALLAMKERVRAGFAGADEVIFDNARSELVIYLDDGTPRLSQAVSFFADTATGGEPTRPTFIVDALTGEILFEYEGLTHNRCSDCLHQADLSGKIRKWQYFEYTVPAGGDLLEISITGGSGDADLYTRKGTDAPTLNTYDCRPYLAGNDEKCSTQAVAGETWQIGIYAYRSYSGVDLLAEVKTLTPFAGTGPGGNQKTDPDGPYYYGTDFGNLDVTADAGTCAMNNLNVKTVDLNHGTSGSTAYEYTCPENLWKEINGAYSPLNDAHYFGGVVFDMYQAYLGVPPLTFQLTMRVHYSNNYENAFWDGSSMTFGDGGSTFHPLVSLDVSAHEVSHGFTEQNSNLTYSGQSGGINEAFSDMAGEAAEFFMRESSDFLVGADIYKGNGALRDMCDPPRDGLSIDHVDDYYPGLDVHYSSGVFNKAFCALAETGWGVEKAFKAFARANGMYWTPSTDFAEGAQGVVDAAVDLGFNTQHVADAFAVVGITGLVLPGSNLPPTADFTYTPAGLTVSFIDASTDADGTVTSWSWSFGDGASSSVQSPVHTYADDGTYTVTLTVTDDDQGTASITKTFALESPPDPGTGPCAAGETAVKLAPSASNQGGTWTAIVDVVNCVDGSAQEFGAQPLPVWTPLEGSAAGCDSTTVSTCQATQSGIRKKTGSVLFRLNEAEITVLKP